MQHITSPYDLVSLPCIRPADVDQAIKTAYPFPKQGFIIWSDTAPDVIADPVLKYFLWGKTVVGVPNKEIYYYNGTSWELIPLLDGSKLLPGSVTLDKLSLAGSSPLYIIQIDALGTSLIWTSVVNAITNGSVPATKLAVPNDTDTFILTSFAGVQAFTELVAFFTAIVDNVIPVTKLVKAGADTLGFYLRTKIDGSAIEWANVDVANLAAAAAIAGQSIRRNAGNTAWEYFSPSQAGVVFFQTLTAVYSGTTVGWTTYDASALVPLDASGIIIQGTAAWNGPGVNGKITGYIRKNGTWTQMIAAQCGQESGTEANISSMQGIFPLDAQKFDYQVVDEGTTGNVTLSICGYTK